MKRGPKLPGSIKDWPLVWQAALRTYAKLGMDLNAARVAVEKDFEAKWDSEQQRRADAREECTVGVYVGRHKRKASP